MCFPLHAWGRVFPEEIHLRKDGMPAYLLRGLGHWALRSQPSNLKTEGILARWPCGFAIDCSCAAYRGGVESHLGDAEQTSLEVFWMAQGGRSGWVPVIPLTPQEVKEGRPSTPELNEIKINSQRSISLCFPPFGNFACVMFMIVVSWPRLWSKFDINKSFPQKEKETWYEKENSNIRKLYKDENLTNIDNHWYFVGLLLQTDFNIQF